MKKIYGLLIIVLCIASCTKDPVTPPKTVDFKDATAYSMRVPLTWNQLFLDAERYTAGYRPPVSARSSAYINYGAYEAIVQGSGGKYKSLANHYGINLRPITEGLEYNWEVVLHHAYERSFELFFPTAPSEVRFRIIERAKTLKGELEKDVSTEVYRNSVDYGRYVADVIYNWSATDTEGHEAYLRNSDPTYVPKQGKGLWQPTFPDFTPALLPRWGKVRTFANIVSVSVQPPHKYQTAAGTRLYEEAKETMDIVNSIKSGSREEDQWIAQFWSDDCPILTFTPAGRWVSITNQLTAIEKRDMMESVAIYAKVGMALSDAGVGCWREKYRHNCLRPIDYIRKNMGLPRWNTVMCPDGTGNFFTPNFPAYPSGHASFGASVAVVLEDIFGTNYTFTDRSHEGRTEFKGDPRTFRSFREMALENAYSRVPLGVHFMSDSRAGTSMGNAIGKRINRLPWR